MTIKHETSWQKSFSLLVSNILVHYTHHYAHGCCRLSLDTYEYRLGTSATVTHPIKYIESIVNIDLQNKPTKVLAHSEEIHTKSN